MMRALTLFAALLLCLGAVRSGVAQNTAPPPSAYVVKGAATAEFLWVLMTDGSVVEFYRTDGSRRVLAEDGVFDILRSSGRLFALRDLGGKSGTYELLELNAGIAILSEISTPSPPVLLDNSDGPALLTRQALFRLEDGAWQRLNFTENLRGWPGNSALSDQGDTVYVGYNRGEWGGGLQGIEISTGRVFDISRIDGNELCDGPLNPACDPVPAVIADRAHPDCILAAVGLAHMLLEGRILRVCGDTVEVDYSAKIPRASLLQKDYGETWPFFDLVGTENGWVAVSYNRLFRSRDGVVSESEIPAPTPWHDLTLTVAGPDFIVLNTSLNARNSLSGDTPLLVPVTE